MTRPTAAAGDPCSDDLRAQRVVLTRVFAEDGRRLPRARLAEVAAQLENADSADAIDRAVRDLVRTGLLHADADVLQLSTAASTLRRLGALF